MTSTFGAATATNPRPFKCVDCKSAFRIHGHLAKHLRSKMHIMKLECLRKLPFGTYAEMERSGVNLNDIDTTDCDTSLTSLQVMARKLCEKDVTGKLSQWEVGIVPNNIISASETSSDEGEANLTHSLQRYSKHKADQNCLVDKCTSSTDINFSGIKVDALRDNSKFKCKICTKLLKSLSALRVHCFVEHNIESGSIDLDVCASTSVEDTINENTHHYERIENTIKELEAGHKINAI